MIPSGELSWEMGAGWNVDSPEVESIAFVGREVLHTSHPLCGFVLRFRGSRDGGGVFVRYKLP